MRIAFGRDSYSLFSDYATRFLVILTKAPKTLDKYAAYQISKSAAYILRVEHFGNSDQTSNALKPTKL